MSCLKQSLKVFLKSSIRDILLSPDDVSKINMNLGVPGRFEHIFAAQAELLHPIHRLKSNPVKGVISYI